MKRKSPQERRCSYVVVTGARTASDDDLGELAGYLSTVGLSDCDVVILDRAAGDDAERRQRTLRWVGRYVAARPEFFLADGDIDLVRAAVDLGACEKVIVATDDVRYTPASIDQMCHLLETHEVVEPQDYVDPLTWWGGIEAGRILVHRGIEPSPDHGATFGIRRGAIRSLHGLGILDTNEDSVRRLAARGAAVLPASDVFVRRKPQPLAEWLGGRARMAGNDFSLPMKTAFFFALGPLLLLLAILGDARLAAGYAGAIGFASVALAVRGRTGARAFFPLRACLYAPLWVVERSVSVYWALLRKLRVTSETRTLPQPEPSHVDRHAHGR